jgi:hypothetical protein
VPFGQERGQRLVAVGGELEEDKPLFRPLDLVVPPVGGRDRAGDLAARGEPRLDRGPGQLHRLDARVGRCLHLDILAALAAACVGSCHAT